MSKPRSNSWRKSESLKAPGTRLTLPDTECPLLFKNQNRLLENIMTFNLSPITKFIEVPAGMSFDLKSQLPGEIEILISEKTSDFTLYLFPCATMEAIGYSLTLTINGWEVHKLARENRPDELIPFYIMEDAFSVIKARYFIGNSGLPKLVDYHRPHDNVVMYTELNLMSKWCTTGSLGNTLLLPDYNGSVKLHQFQTLYKPDGGVYFKLTVSGTPIYRKPGTVICGMREDISTNNHNIATFDIVMSVQELIRSLPIDVLEHKSEHLTIRTESIARYYINSDHVISLTVHDVIPKLTSQEMLTSLIETLGPIKFIYDKESIRGTIDVNDGLQASFHGECYTLEGTIPSLLEHIHVSLEGHYKYKTMPSDIDTLNYMSILNAYRKLVKKEV